MHKRKLVLICNLQKVCLWGAHACGPSGGVALFDTAKVLKGIYGETMQLCCARATIRSTGQRQADTRLATFVTSC